MTWYELFKAMAIIQGSWCFGMSAAIMYYYMRHVKFSMLQVHIVCVVIAHNLLTWATIVSVMSDKWTLGDFWFWLIGGAYLLTDISVYIVWKMQMKKRHSPKS